MKELFRNPGVVNIGVSSFSESIRAAGGRAIHVEWSPPASGDAACGTRLAALLGRREIEEANREAFGRYLAAQPVLEAVGTAGDDIPDMGERMILHAGPPVEWSRMCGPMRGTA